MKVKLHRDLARTIDNYWMPFMIKMAWADIRNNSSVPGKFLTAKMLFCLLNNVSRSIKQKLLGTKPIFTISLTDSEAVALYLFMMRMPIDNVYNYGIVMRQQICDHLHEELFSDMPGAPEPPPETISDYFSQMFE